MMMLLLLQPLSLLQLPAWPLLPLLPLLLLLGWVRQPASHNLMACVCVLILAHSSKRIFVSFMHKTTRARIFLVCEKNTCTFCGQTWVYESTTLCGGQNHLKTMCSQRTASLLRQCILHGDKEAGRQLHRVASALLPGVLQEKVCCQQADCAFFLLERIWH